MEDLSRFGSIDLAQLNAQAELLKRFDTKYIVKQDRLVEFFSQLPASLLVLENRGQRVTPYSTCYFDSSDLHTYYDHLKQRRKRFKIRTRFYHEPDDGHLEIKIKKPRNQTEKIRWSYDLSSIGQCLGPKEIALLNQALQSAFYPHLSHQYQRIVDTDFHRITMFDPQSLERITIDTQLIARTTETALAIGTHHAIIEIKSPAPVGQTHRIFTQMGIRSTSLSKYCLAMTAIDPSLGGAPWRGSLRLLGTSPAS